MTKEEKKAIEYWKAKLKDYKKEIIQRQNDEFKGYGTSEDIAKLKYCNLHTVLNLIQKQQEEIEKLNQDNKKLDKQAQEYFENLMFKDKVIHEMLEYIFDEDTSNYICKQMKDKCDNRCIECYLKYFQEGLNNE